MLDPERYLTVINECLKSSPAPETEVVIFEQNRESMRIAANQPIQTGAVHDCLCYARVADRGRVGVAATSSPDREELRKAVKRAWQIAKLQPEPTDYHLPELTENFMTPGQTAAAGYLADYPAPVLKELKQAGFSSSGIFSAVSQVMAIGGSAGMRGYHSQPGYSYSCVAEQDGLTGYAGRWGRSLRLEDLLEAAGEAMALAAVRLPILAVDPGCYEVVLSPYAVADLVWLLQYMGFSAQALLEGRSFLTGRLNTRIVSPKLTLRDDPADGRGYIGIFDWEGVPKRPLDLIKNGVALSPVYDSWTGWKMGRESTGHAVPAVYSENWPFPAHLKLEPGFLTERELIALVAKGIYINRFHYVNVVEPRTALATGMTRDANYYIEEGVLKGRIANLRFTENLLRAFSRVEVGNNPRFIFDGETGMIVPSLKLDAFHFTS